MKEKLTKRQVMILFFGTLAAVVLIFIWSIVKTNIYNSVRHKADYTGTEIFSEEGSGTEDVSIVANTRGSTWSKAFDLRRSRNRRYHS